MLAAAVLEYIQQPEAARLDFLPPDAPYSHPGSDFMPAEGVLHACRRGWHWSQQRWNVCSSQRQLQLGWASCTLHRPSIQGSHHAC